MLKDLIASIRAQDFPQDQIEILVMGEEYGDSEQAKAAGIRQAKGEICAMFCADNKLITTRDFSAVSTLFRVHGEVVSGIYSSRYAVVKRDNSLNRYFSLIGNNDPICFYLGKSDRRPYYEDWDKPIAWSVFNFSSGKIPSLGDNGFYIRRSHIPESSLTNYYPMDMCFDMVKSGKPMFIRTGDLDVWHRTSDNLLNFLKKRYRYARDLYCDRADRRWKMLEKKRDYLRLGGFILSTVTIFPCLSLSLRGFNKVRDFAWFWHWPVCLGFLITYTILAIRNLFKHGHFFQVKCPLPA